MSAAKDLLDEAVSASGLDDFGDDSFREGLGKRSAENREIAERPGPEVFGIDGKAVRPLFAEYSARFTDR